MVTVTCLTSREGSAGGQGRTRRARLGAGPHLPRRAPALSRVRGSRLRQAACFLSPARDAQRAANTDYAFRVFRVQGRAPGGRHRRPSSPRPPRAAPSPPHLPRKPVNSATNQKAAEWTPEPRRRPVLVTLCAREAQGPGGPRVHRPRTLSASSSRKGTKASFQGGCRTMTGTENGEAGGGRGSDNVQGLEWGRGLAEGPREGPGGGGAAPCPARGDGHRTLRV